MLAPFVRHADAFSATGIRSIIYGPFSGHRYVLSTSGELRAVSFVDAGVGTTAPRLRGATWQVVAGGFLGVDVDRQTDLLYALHTDGTVARLLRRPGAAVWGTWKALPTGCGPVRSLSVDQVSGVLTAVTADEMRPAGNPISHGNVWLPAS